MKARHYVWIYNCVSVRWFDCRRRYFSYQFKKLDCDPIPKHSKQIRIWCLPYTVRRDVAFLHRQRFKPILSYSQGHMSHGELALPQWLRFWPIPEVTNSRKIFYVLFVCIHFTVSMLCIPRYDIPKN